MTVPGVSLVSAAAFVAAAGDIHRFSSPKKLVSYVGLDPQGRRRGRYSGPRVHETKAEREHEREFAEQVETAYRRLAEDWQPKPPKSGAGATRGRASSSHLLDEETAARQG